MDDERLDDEVDEAAEEEVPDPKALGDKMTGARKRRRDVLRALGRYGRDHPETWAGVTLEDSEPFRVIAYVSGDPKKERALVASLFPAADDVVFRRVAMSRFETEQLRKEVLDRFGAEPGIYGASTGYGQVRVMVRDDFPELAEAVEEEFGERVSITLAPFPEGRPTRARRGSRATPSRGGSESAPRQASAKGRKLAPMTKASEVSGRRTVSGRKVEPMARRGGRPSDPRMNGKHRSSGRHR